MKRVVLVFIKHYLPGFRFGGPVRTISNLVDWLGDEYDFHIITLDRDFNSSEPYCGVQPDQWRPVGKGRVIYLKRISLGRIVGLFNEVNPDLVYMNSFFEPRFTLLPSLAIRLFCSRTIPMLLAPRGELSSGALAIKRLKKKIYLAVFRFLRVDRQFVLQASSNGEKEDICRNLKICRKSVRSAIDLPSRWFLDSASIELQRKRKNGFEPLLKIVFLSRISRMKNLSFALRVLMNIDRPVLFTIYGVVEDEAYWEECLEIVRSLPEHIHAVFAGAVDGHEVVRVLSEHDIFFLPTLGENYGHVIHEALAAGLAVLISDRTPWGNISKHRVGWEIDLNYPEKFRYQIENARVHGLEGIEVAEACRKFAAHVSTDNDAIDANRQLLDMALRYVRKGQKLNEGAG